MRLSSLLLFSTAAVQLAVSIQLPDAYDVVWTTQSENSGASMPFGGGDIGCNLWVENNTVLFYIAKAGTFDDANTLVKLGRVRLTLDPNPFASGQNFEQRLLLNDGYVKISAGNGTALNFWVDISNSIIHVDIDSNTPVSLTAAYESWRYVDRNMTLGTEADQSSWDVAKSADGKPISAVTYADNITYSKSGVLMSHRNRDYTIFDFSVGYEGLGSYIDQMYNPLAGRTYGLWMSGDGLAPSNSTTMGYYINTDYKSWSLESQSPSTNFSITIVTECNQYSTMEEFSQVLDPAANQISNTQADSLSWWHDFWDRSYIFINPNASSSDASFQVGKNYNIFRYMLGCNAQSDWPTKWNGGLFTFDPVTVSSSYPFTPDYRRWTGGVHTAQNQRLLYWPLLRSGDFDLMKAQFEFYRRITPNAQLRGVVNFGINHTVFTEQIESWGLPNFVEWDGSLYYFDEPRPAGFSTGNDWNRWLDYLFDTANEFADMILQANMYDGLDVTPYLQFIENQLQWYDVYYQQLAYIRDGEYLDSAGNLILFPSTGQETYKGAYNSASTSSGLRKLLSDLIAVNPDFQVGNLSYYQGLYDRIPPTPIRTVGSWTNNYTAVSPAVAYNRVQNSEPTALYTVFPWGEYGLGKPNLTYAINAYLNDPEIQSFRDIVGWKQDPIWVARMGLNDLAQQYISEKLTDSTAYRFPAFWGPNFDWSPDMNHGGSAMIALQEMLMQTDNRTIRLVPTWPTNWTTTFKLHAPYNTTVEGDVVDGQVTNLVVTPSSRLSDVIYGQ